MANLKHSLRSYFKTPIFSLEKNFICFSGNLYRKIAIFVQYIGRNASPLRKIRSAPENFGAHMAHSWGRILSQCKKLCKILNRLGGVSIEAQIIDEKAPLEPLQLASCSRLKTQTCFNIQLTLAPFDS